MIKTARTSKNTSISFYQISPPFSNFSFIDKIHYFHGCHDSLKRIFSQARRNKCKTLIIEDIIPAGAILDENNELKQIYPDYSNPILKRLTFWNVEIKDEIKFLNIKNKHLQGYAIVKQDYIPNINIKHSHVFESVFIKYQHIHNFVPISSKFLIYCNNNPYYIKGVMYCQQNQLNKACAQVALRSLLMNKSLKQDITYSEINKIAEQNTNNEYKPEKGLNSNQIRAILNHYKLKYIDIDYTEGTLSPNELFYGKILYQGIENSIGGLLGFKLTGSDAQESMHILPFFGHTFNQDTWAPRAQNAYFHMGEETKYISSDEWLSSFLCHDDNFGSNFYIPKKFIDPYNVTYAVAILPDNAKYDGIIAELTAIDYLYSIFSHVPKNMLPNLKWLSYLKHYTKKQDIVLRTIFITNIQYINYIQRLKDWDGNKEYKDLKKIKKILPKYLWMIELSIPELFSTNYSKLGEIILDASSSPLDNNIALSNLVLTKSPGTYLFNISSKDNQPKFVPLSSNLKSHVSLYKKGRLFF